MTEIKRLTNALREVIQEVSIGERPKTANGAFGGAKPLELVERGESDCLWEMIYFLRLEVSS